MRSLCILILLVGSAAHGASTVTVRGAISAYAKPDFDAPVTFTVEAGSKVTVADKIYGGFRKIKAVIDGKSRIGYVTASDLVTQNAPPKEKRWGAGAGLVYTQISQGEKTFTTDDQVTYKITGYSGTNTSPAFSLQFGQRNFWRLYGAYKTVSLSGRATNQVGGAAQDIEVEYKMAAFGGQAGWGLFSKVVYGGAGFEVAKTMSGKVRFGTQDLSNQTEYPDYLGAHIFLGAQLRMGSSLSAFLEARMGAIPNQDPMLTVVEISATLLFWP